MERIKLDLRRAAEWVVLEVGGEIDMATAPALDRRLDEAQQQGDGRVVVDLSRVEFMDSSGLRALVRQLERDDPPVLAGAPERIRKLFEVAGLDGRFRFVDDVADVTG